MDHPDAELLVRLRDGDLRAFEEIVERFERRLIRYFHSLCGDGQLAEDCAQEVFVRIYRARASYEPTASAATFIFRIARNYWIDVYRTRKGRPNERSLDQPLGADSDQSLHERVAIDETPVDAALAGQDDLTRLRAALARLPEIHRSVLMLAGRDGMKYEHVAATLGIPVGTVKSRVHAAVGLLRRLMGVDLEDPESR